MSLGVGDKSLDATKFKEVLRAQVELLQREAENLDEIRQYVVYSLFPLKIICLTSIRLEKKKLLLLSKTELMTKSSKLTVLKKNTFMDL